MIRRQPVPPREQFSLFDETLPLRREDAIASLPKSVQELVEVIGLDATIDLVKACGGDEFRVPEVVGGVSRMWALLEETMGPHASAKLVARYGGTHLSVAKCYHALLHVRNRRVLERIDAGEDFDAVRRDLNITRRHLFRMLKDARHKAATGGDPV